MNSYVGPVKPNKDRVKLRRRALSSDEIQIIPIAIFQTYKTGTDFSSNY